MSVSTVLSYLNGYSGFNALVGGRVYRTKFPQNITYPSVLFEVNREISNTLGGETTPTKYQYNFKIHAKGYDSVESILTQLKAAISAATSFSGICLSVSDGEFQEEQVIYTMMVDFSIWE